MRTLFKEGPQMGWGYAIHRFYQRRHLALVAYLILAGFTIFAFSLERKHSNENRRILAEQTRQTLIKACERQNELRGALRHIVRQSNGAIKLYVKDGTITPQQGRVALAQNVQALSVLADTNCVKLYIPPRN